MLYLDGRDAAEIAWQAHLCRSCNDDKDVCRGCGRCEGCGHHPLCSGCDEKRSA